MQTFRIVQRRSFFLVHSTALNKGKYKITKITKNKQYNRKSLKSLL